MSNSQLIRDFMNLVLTSPMLYAAIVGETGRVSWQLAIWKGNPMSVQERPNGRSEATGTILAGGIALDAHAGRASAAAHHKMRDL